MTTSLMVAWLCGVVYLVWYVFVCAWETLRSDIPRWQVMARRWVRRRWVNYCERVVYHDYVRRATELGVWELSIDRRRYPLPKERRANNGDECRVDG